MASDPEPLTRPDCPSPAPLWGPSSSAPPTADRPPPRPHFSPKLFSGSRGVLARRAVPWHCLRLSPTGCQSVVPSLSPLSTVLSAPHTGRQAGGGGGRALRSGPESWAKRVLCAPCHLSSCHSPTQAAFTTHRLCARSLLVLRKLPCSSPAALLHWPRGALPGQLARTPQHWLLALSGPCACGLKGLAGG